MCKLFRLLRIEWQMAKEGAHAKEEALTGQEIKRLVSLMEAYLKEVK